VCSRSYRLLVGESPTKARLGTPARIFLPPAVVEVKKAGCFALSLSKGCAFVQVPPSGYSQGKLLHLSRGKEALDDGNKADRPLHCY